MWLYMKILLKSMIVLFYIMLPAPWLLAWLLDEWLMFGSIGVAAVSIGLYMLPVAMYDWRKANETSH